MRPAGTPVEPGGNAGALERVLEKARVPLGRSYEHGNLIEGHTTAGFVQHTAGNFHAFAPFPGRREQPDVSLGRTFWRPSTGEQVPSQRDQI